METIYDSRPASPWRVLTRIVWYALDLLIALLALRLVLKLLGANTAAGFTQFIYSFTSPFASPFAGVIPPTVIPGESVMEWSTLLAMLVYWIIAGAIVRLLALGNSPATTVHPANHPHMRETKTVTITKDEDTTSISNDRRASVRNKT